MRVLRELLTIEGTTETVVKIHFKLLVDVLTTILYKLTWKGFFEIRFFFGSKHHELFIDIFA